MTLLILMCLNFIIVLLNTKYDFINYCSVLSFTCSIWGSLHVCVFNVIVLLLAISHARASFSDPGESQANMSDRF